MPQAVLVQSASSIAIRGQGAELAKPGAQNQNPATPRGCWDVRRRLCLVGHAARGCAPELGAEVSSVQAGVDRKMLSPNRTQLWALDLLQERSVKGRVQNPFLSQRILLRGRLAFIFLLVLVEARARVKHPDCRSSVI